MTIPFRPLSEVKMLLEEAGADVSYAYDDLVFVEHTAFLLQFDDEKPSNLKIYFNTDIDDKRAEAEYKKLLPFVEKHKMSLTASGKFSLKQKEEAEELDILFYPL